jgi:hypothetical protein
MALPSPSSCLCWTLLLVAACGRGDHGTAATAGGPPPHAEFLVATQDSTFWIATKGSTVRTRGVPITLAQYDGRFFEIYLADDDRSYQDALLVGFRVYRRDLIAGDSALVFEDSIVPRIAREYASAHPSARRLSPDQDGSEDPSTQAMADLQVIDVHGPYLSYEYHVDLQARGAEPWHATRRGVIDLRSGRSTRVSDLFSSTVASALVDSGKRELLAAIDSLRGDSRAPAERAVRELSRVRFDERSFVLTVPDSQVAVEFDVPQRGTDAPDEVIPLDALRPQQPPWWSSVSHDFAEVGDNLDRWRRFGDTGYDVLARYDSSAETARISLSDHVREWPVRAVAAPVLHVFWLDRPALDSTTRRALSRAFDAAAQYDEATRTVVDMRRHSASPVRFAASRSSSRRSIRRHA